MSFTIQNELDNNENPVIQGLEALLICDDPHEEPFCESFEDMRTKLKHSFSLDQSKDSGIVFSNLSLKQIPSVNSSIQNVCLQGNQKVSNLHDLTTLFHCSNLSNLDILVNCLIPSVSSHQ